MCTFGSLPFVPTSQTCKMQSSVSHSTTESEVSSLDACLRMDGIPALDQLNLVIEVLHSSPRGGWAHGRCSCVRSVGLGHWSVTFVSTFIPRPRETRGIAITVRDTSQMTSVTEISHVGGILVRERLLTSLQTHNFLAITLCCTFLKTMRQ